MTNKSLTTVDFHGATLTVLRGASPADTLVAMKPVVEGMGLNWEKQRIKIRNHPVLVPTLRVVPFGSSGGEQDSIALPLNRLNFWLATIHPNRVPDPETRARVIAYQTECADALFDHFFGKAMGGPIDRQTNGIAKSTIHKVTMLEQTIGDMSARVDQMMEAFNTMVVASDPRVAAVVAIPALQVAIEQGVKKRPRGFALRVSNALLRYCEGRREFVIHHDIYDRRLFPRAAVNEWLARGGWGPIKDSLDQKRGQGVLRFPRPHAAE